MAESKNTEQLIAEARAWIAGDPDETTRAELQALVDGAKIDELAERMAAPLEFGTAGLRGVVGAGENRMNRAVVIRATRGLADYLLARETDARILPVVVGYDGRLTSRQFAEDTVAVLVAAGVPVRFFDAPVPTPIVAFAARQLSATAAIVVTASHNPPEYNGYKVYASNAAQIVPPVDTEIAARVAAVGPAQDVKRADGAMRGHAKAERVPDSMFERYWMELDAVRPRGAADKNFRIVYTPMHGVGLRFARPALERAGYGQLSVVAEQAEPDGNFPTVRFPNPEEPGALDLARALAERSKAELILANDPDADRLAVCVPTVTGRWVQLTGNQVGVLLADFVLEHAAKTPTPLVIESIVSSPMLASIAKAYGARFDQTLTGFKWIWNAALDLEAKGGARFVFGFEEALGYSVGHIVRDKDGISAAVLFADLAARCKAGGESVIERLARLYKRHGLWVSLQKSVVRPGTEGHAEIEAAMKRLGVSPPSELGGRKVTAAEDFRAGGALRARWLPDTELIVLELDGKSRVLVRPSGTEPKLKIYVDLCAELGPGETVSGREDSARAEAETIAEQVVHHVGLAS
jgi:phosphomannomutase